MQNLELECREIWDRMRSSPKIIIYGAGKIARALHKMLCSFLIDIPVFCFCVTKKENNPEYICGLPIHSVDDLSTFYQEAIVLLAANQDQDSMRREIKKYTEKEPYYCGYKQPLWNFIYEEYTKRVINYFGGNIQPVIEYGNINAKSISVFKIQTHHDKTLNNQYMTPHWLIPLQAGKAMTDKLLCDMTDDKGEHISGKNDRYCELTGSYWIWKNCKDDYKGICHYRRCLNIADKKEVLKWNADVILPYPVIASESLEEEYFKEHIKGDWDVMLHVLQTFYPDYYEASQVIFKEALFYPGNIVIAKANCFDEYCSWLFTVLFEVEKKTLPKENKYQNRYLGFLAERLTTLYFIYNKGKMKITHSELLLLT